MVMYTTPTKFPFDCFRLIHLSILVILLPLALNAQEDNLNIRFDNISIKDGLSQSSPNCIFQDSRGILWIGTEDGLNKYDGYSFVVYKPEQNDQFSISNPRILTICEDADAFLWIGTNGGGLNKYDRKTNRFYQFSTRKTGFPFNQRKPGLCPDTFVRKRTLGWNRPGVVHFRFENQSFCKFRNQSCTKTTL